METNRSSWRSENASSFNDAEVVKVFVDMLEVRAEVRQEQRVLVERLDQVVSVTTCEKSYHIDSKLTERRSIPTSVGGSEKHDSTRSPPYGLVSTIEIRCQQSLGVQSERKGKNYPHTCLTTNPPRL